MGKESNATGKNMCAKNHVSLNACICMCVAWQLVLQVHFGIEYASRTHAHYAQTRLKPSSYKTF